MTTEPTTRRNMSHACNMPGCSMPGSISSGSEWICHFHHGVRSRDLATATARINRAEFRKIYSLGISMLNGVTGAAVTAKQTEWLAAHTEYKPFMPPSWAPTVQACGKQIMAMLTAYVTHDMGRAESTRTAGEKEQWKTAFSQLKTSMATTQNHNLDDLT